MPRPPLPIGSWGKISTTVTKTDSKGKAIRHMAKANFRDHDGQVRDVRAAGRTPSAAEQALLVKLRDRAKLSQTGELTAMHKVGQLIDLWEKKFKKLVEIGKRSPTSYDTYERVLRNHIRPAIAELRIGEATTRRLDKVISTISDRSGSIAESVVAALRSSQACRHLAHQADRAIVTSLVINGPGRPGRRPSLRCGRPRAWS